MLEPRADFCQGAAPIDGLLFPWDEAPVLEPGFKSD